jgi:hypothetical protein
MNILLALILAGLTINGDRTLDGNLTTSQGKTITATAASSAAGPAAQIQLDGNSALTTAPTCSNQGSTGKWTLVDIDNTSGTSWMICDGTGNYMRLFSVTDAAASAEMLVASGTGTAAWVPISGDLAITSAGVATISPTALNIQSQDYDGTPTVATPRTAKYPNDTVVDEGGNSMRIEPKWTVPYFYPGLRIGPSSSMCVGTYAAANAMNVILNTVTYVPIYIPQKTVVVEIGFRSSAVMTGTNLKIGLYSTVNGLPGTLLDSTIIAGPAGDTSAVDITNINVAVGAGWYWIAFIPSASIGSMRGMGDNQCMSLGDNANGETNPLVFIRKTQAYATGLPASSGLTYAELMTPAASGGILIPSASTTRMPFVWVRSCLNSGFTCSENNQCCSGTCTASACT